MGLLMQHEPEPEDLAQHPLHSGIWHEPQFTVADVCKIAGTTPKALEHFLNPQRGLVRLVGPHANPGTGRRRLLTGSEVLAVKTAYVMNRLGFPQRWSISMTDTVVNRAQALSVGFNAGQTDLTILTYPMSNGDWSVIPIYAERADVPKIPVAVLALEVDRLITETVAQLEAIVAGDEVPDFTVPDPEPEPNPYSPKANFFKQWEKNAAGRWVYVGLNAEETDELLLYQGLRLNGDDIEIVGPPEADGQDRQRKVDLDRRHEEARLKAVAADMVQRREAI